MYTCVLGGLFSGGFDKITAYPVFSLQVISDSGKGSNFGIIPEYTVKDEDLSDLPIEEPFGSWISWRVKDTMTSYLNKADWIEWKFGLVSQFCACIFTVNNHL
jgi:hypothetical protein